MISTVFAVMAGSAPAFRSVRTASARPRAAAAISAVCPHDGSFAFTSAPAVINAVIVPGTPATAARCKGVAPSVVAARASAFAASRARTTPVAPL